MSNSPVENSSSLGTIQTSNSNAEIVSDGRDEQARAESLRGRARSASAEARQGETKSKNQKVESQSAKEKYVEHRKQGTTLQLKSIEQQERGRHKLALGLSTFDKDKIKEGKEDLNAVRKLKKNLLNTPKKLRECKSAARNEKQNQIKA